MAGSQDIPKRPPKCLGKKNLDCFVRFPGVPGSPRVSSQKVQRRLEKVERRLEKVREGQRKYEKV